MFAPTNYNMHKQAECWPMSTSKVSKYNNYNNNIIMTISISISSNPSTVHQTYYEMTATDKLPLITESVAVTRIDIHPAREEPNQHAIRLTPGGSHIRQPFAKSLLCQNWSPTHGWSLGSRPHSPSHNILKARGAVRWSSYKATRLTGPHKNMTCGQYTTQGLPSGPKMAQTLTDMDGYYHIETSK
jgi:hypothetical protein